MRWILAIWLWIGTAVADPVVVFAAASLKEPLDQMTAGTDVVVSYAGSGTLARQVIQGAPADVILLANATWMDEVAAALDVINVADFASNQLVLIGQDGADTVDPATGLIAALANGPLAMGFTTAVPAGIYGREALTALGLWDRVASQVAEVDNVRSVLTLISRGEAPLGIAYMTDARITDKVDVLARFDPKDHSPIRYVGAALTPRGAEFWARVLGPDGQAALARAGFTQAQR